MIKIPRKTTVKNNINKSSFSLSDQIFFSQRLSLLLNSGISTIEALSIIRKMDNSPRRKLIYELMIRYIEKGVSLSRVIINENIKFNHFLILLIQNGELSGNLSNTLLQACSFLEKKNEMKGKIISSLIYPTFIIFFTFIMTLFLILYIFPKIIPLVESLNVELPLITRIVQGIYYFSIEYGIYLLISGVFFVLILLFLLKKYKSLRYKLHSGYIKIPFVAHYIKIYSVLSMCYVGEILLSSGRSVSDVVLASKEHAGNLVYKNVFGNIRIDLLRGVALSASMKKWPNVFPDLLPHMCELGERTGNLGMMLGNCAKVFDQEIDSFLKRFTSLIEPVLMVFMGLIVGSIALSIILPVYEITNNLGK